MPILLEPNKSFVLIEVLYINQKNNRIYIIKDNKDLESWLKKGYEIEEQSSSPKKRIYKLLTYWTRLTWGEHVKITNKSLMPTRSQNKTITYEINPSIFRSLKINQCLKRWNYSDENGKELPVTEELVNSLDPDLVLHLLKTFESLTEPTANDKKNLIDTAKDFFTGKKIKHKELLPWIYEGTMLSLTSMNLEEIRNMDYTDFENLLTTITIYNAAQDGVYAEENKTTKKDSLKDIPVGAKRTITKKFDPETNSFI